MCLPISGQDRAVSKLVWAMPSVSDFDAVNVTFSSIREVRAENRPKSKVEIWKRTENVVLLHCQNDEVDEAVLKGKNCEH